MKELVDRYIAWLHRTMPWLGRDLPLVLFFSAFIPSALCVGLIKELVDRWH